MSLILPSCFCKKEYNLMIGERTAEQIKITIGNVF